jgi:hypothetical protein
MVDALSSLALAYSQSTNLQAQSSSSGTSLSLQQQTKAALVEQSANGDIFGAAVEIDISVTAQSSSTAAADATPSAGQKALATIEQSNAQARAFPKQLAAQQLDHAVKELTILKLLGSGPKAVKEAGKIAKEIGDAAKAYGGAEQDQLQAGDISSIPDPTTDPFYQVANAALDEVNKFLKKTLPALENSTDPKTRDVARKAKHEFDKATTELQAAENGGDPAAATGVAANAADSTLTVTETETVSTVAATTTAPAASAA